MPNWRIVEWGAVAVVVLTLVVAGFSPGAAEHSRPRLDDGTAAVTVVTAPGETLAIERGRFGTGVYYLRVPDVGVRVDGLEGTPRLVYQVTVPELDVRVTATRLVRAAGRTPVRGADRGLDRDDVTADEYAATVALRVQSSAVDETVYRRSVTLGVDR